MAQLLGTLFVLGGGIVLLFSGRYVRRGMRARRAKPVETIDPASDGALVRLVGTVDGATGDSLTAPFSGREAVVLRYAVEERRLSPYLLPWFVTIHERSGSKPFQLRTPAAVVPIDAPVGTVVLQTDPVATVTPGEDPPDRLARFEQRESTFDDRTIWRSPPRVFRPVLRRLGLGTRRYTEQSASAGDRLTVVGRVDAASGQVQPLVVGDGSPRQLFFRMARTAIAGVGIGFVVFVLGLALLWV
jgi:hypothetical protein